VSYKCYDYVRLADLNMIPMKDERGTYWVIDALEVERWITYYLNNKGEFKKFRKKVKKVTG